MILVDLNQVMLSNLLMQLGNHTNAEIEEGMVRHMVLNSLRSYRTKFGPEYGELVIACDNTNYWRKQYFPYYKANRKKARENSDLDWKAVFECLNKIRQELKEFFPYKVVDIESAEADDIIGTIANNYGSELDFGEKILILSGDKDYIQLHKYSNVKQYDPTRKKWVTHNDPQQYLKEHILRGDSGDGVPNVLSSDNCFVVRLFYFQTFAFTFSFITVLNVIASIFLITIFIFSSISTLLIEIVIFFSFIILIFSPSIPPIS